MKLEILNYNHEFDSMLKKGLVVHLSMDIDIDMKNTGRKVN